jgi:hypothetical protein
MTLDNQNKTTKAMIDAGLIDRDLYIAGLQAFSGEHEREQLDSLIGLLNSPEAHQYFREPFIVKLIALSVVLRNGNISQSAKAFGVSHQAVSRQVQRVRKIWRIATPRCGVD